MQQLRLDKGDLVGTIRFFLFALACLLTLPLLHADPVCEKDFGRAAGLFKDVLGPDVDVANLPEFTTTLNQMSAKSRIIKSGDSIFLQSIVPTPFGNQSVYVPVNVCKDGNTLSATLITSLGKVNGLPLAKVYNKLAAQYVLNIKRDNNDVVFTSDSVESRVPISSK